MAIDKIFGRKDKLTFGKNKGKTIAELLKGEVEYLLWLRKERRKQMMEIFDDDVNGYLDDVLKSNSRLQKEFSSTPIAKKQKPTPITGLTTQPDRSEFYDDQETGWGAF